MDKSVILEYMDARALVEETMEDIRKLERRKSQIVHDSVKGSMQDFPYAPTSFRLEGITYGPEDESNLDREREILEDRRAQAEHKRLEAEAIINQASARMQRIIRYRVMMDFPWEEVARRMGGRCTGDSARMEFQKWLKDS